MYILHKYGIDKFIYVESPPDPSKIQISDDMIKAAREYNYEYICRYNNEIYFDEILSEAINVYPKIEYLHDHTKYFGNNKIKYIVFKYCDEIGNIVELLNKKFNSDQGDNVDVSVVQRYINTIINEKNGIVLFNNTKYVVHRILYENIKTLFKNR